MSLATLRSTDVLDDIRLPPELEAGQPAELRGVPRDQVSLMVAGPDGIEHRKFKDLVSVLRPGDLLIVNNSATLPAAVLTSEGRVIHFSTSLPGNLRVVEVRRIEGDGTTPLLDLQPGSLPLPDGGSVELLTPYPIGSSSRRLWAAYLDSSEFDLLLAAHGKPITYQHNSGQFPTSMYQTVFARKPGSAEMPSAGRPFTSGLVSDLVAEGVGMAPITLHAGVSSLETGESPYAEQFIVPETTARAINSTRSTGGRVIAVGTTVVRAIQTVSDTQGLVSTGQGWTEIVVGPEDAVPAIDGMISGWHEPRSTHLDMLIAVGGRDLVAASYGQALDLGYLWHEFGDSHLIWRRR